MTVLASGEHGKLRNSSLSLSRELGDKPRQAGGSRGDWEKQVEARPGGRLASVLVQEQGFAAQLPDLEQTDYQAELRLSFNFKSEPGIYFTKLSKY